MRGALGTFALGLLAVVSTLSAGLEAGSFARAMPARMWCWLLAANLALVPLIAATALWPLHLPEDVTAGLFLAASIPGGASGPLVAAMASREPGPAPAALFVVLALLAGVLVPIVAALGGLALDPIAMLAVLGVQLVPWAAGAWLRRARPELARRWLRPLQRAGAALLIGVIIGLIVAEGDAVGVVGWPALGASTLIVTATAALFLLAPGRASLSEPRANAPALTSISLVRNLALALLVAAAASAPAATSLAILVFGIAMFVIAIGLALWLRDR